jgi:hypothetical protein
LLRHNFQNLVDVNIKADREALQDVSKNTSIVLHMLRLFGLQLVHEGLDLVLASELAPGIERTG